MDLHENPLRQVFGLARVANGAMDRVDHRALVALDQFPKGVRVALRTRSMSATSGSLEVIVRIVTQSVGHGNGTKVLLPPRRCSVGCLPSCRVRGPHPLPQIGFVCA